MQVSQKNMDILTNEDLQNLLAEHQSPCVSIFMPAIQKDGYIQNQTRFKNLLRHAEDQLPMHSVRPIETKEFFEQAEAKLNDSIYWQYHSQGLAIFIAPGETYFYRLPVHFEELVVVGKKFHIKPLLPALTGDGRFYILALNQGGFRFLQATRYTAVEIELIGVPKSLQESEKYDIFERGMQAHSSSAPAIGGSAAIFHGQGTMDDTERKKRILDFFHKIEHEVTDLLTGQNTPLILAGVEYIRALYTEANHSEQLLQQGLDFNPELYSNEDLLKEAWKEVAPIFQQDRNQARDLYRQLMGSKIRRASDKLGSILQAGFEGRVQSLFVEDNSHAWGVYDPIERKLQVRKEGQPGDEDLLDLAATYTLKGRGSIYVVPREEMPNGGPLCAIFRY